MQAPALRLRVHTHDGRGLIWGYRLGGMEPLTVDGAQGMTEGAVWYHFNLADGRARKWLERESGMPQVALELMLDPHPRVRTLPLPGGLVGTLEDLHHDFSGDPEGFGELRFYIDERRVISARRHPLQSVDDMHRRLLRERDARDTAEWLEQMVCLLSRNFAESVRDMRDQVDQLEDEIVAGKSTPAQRNALGALRRLLVRFRRHVNENRQALTRLRGAPLDEAYVQASRQGAESFEGVAQDLDLINERVRLLQEEVSGLLAEATNRNLYVLSIVTTATLPATLLTGIWGMNVGGLPWREDSHGIIWSGIALILSIIISLALLRASRF